MDSFAHQLERARDVRAKQDGTRRYSRESLSHATGKVDGKRPYVSEPTIAAIEKAKTVRPSDATILRLGDALGVPDSVLPSYVLARARRQLDEFQIGDAALRNLRLVHPILLSDEPPLSVGRVDPARLDDAARRLADLAQQLRENGQPQSPRGVGAKGGTA